jgi:hypothetical protein
VSAFIWIHIRFNFKTKTLSKPFQNHWFSFLENILGFKIWFKFDFDSKLYFEQKLRKVVFLKSSWFKFWIGFQNYFFQKSQISVFGKYLNLFEFENVFDLNYNFGFKFKTIEKKLQKLFYFSGGPNRFRPKLSWSLVHLSSLTSPASSSPFLVQSGPPLRPVHVAQVAHFSLSAQLRPAPSSPSSGWRPNRRRLLSLVSLPPPHRPHPREQVDMKHSPHCITSPTSS